MRHAGRRATSVMVMTLIVTTVAHAAEGETADTRADFYVAPGGNDAWSGSLSAPNPGKTDGPFATLARAQAAARALKATQKRGATVLVRGGTYLLKDMLRFGPEDSGTADRPLVFAAYPKEQPVLSGAAGVTSRWEKAEGGVWTTRPQLGQVRLEDLYVNGARQTCARMPNEGFWKAERVGNSRRQFGSGNGELKDWPDVQSGVAVVKPYEWVDFHLPIKSVDAATKVVTLAEDCGYEVVPANGTGEYYVENVRAALDQRGEWCFDAKTGVLTFLPPPDLDLAKAEMLVGRLPVLVALDGDAPKDRWVEHIELRGFTFRYTGRYERWRNFQGSAVRLNHGVRQCRIAGCRFEDLGGSGVVVWKECRENSIFGNEFTRTGDTPVHVFDYLSEGPAMSFGNTIENNYVHHCGTVWKSIAGIQLAMTGGNQVAHNLICDMPYNGISLSGTRPEYWSRKSEPSIEPPYTAEKIKPFVPSLKNVVEKNHIHHVMQELYDGGGIYFWGVMGNGANVIRGNLIHHVGRGKRTCVGVYLDDNCDGVHAYDNIVYSANIGMHLHGCPQNIVENNFFAYSQTVDISVQPEKYNVAPMNTVVRRNIFYRSLGRVFSDTHWAAWDKLPLGEMNHNLYWAAGKPVALGQGTFKGMDKDSLVADPLFVDPEHGDFRLRDNSPAFRLGIKAISVEQVGPRPNALNAFTIPEITPDARDPIIPPPRKAQAIMPTRAVGAVTVDGELNEDIWKKAESHAMKTKPDKDAIAGPPCLLQVAYDDTRLYVALTAPVKDAKRLRLGRKWGTDDGAEVCLKNPAGEAGPVYVIHGFAAGSSESVTEAGAREPAAKELGQAVAFAAHVGTDRWTAEWAVPWASLKFNPAKGAKLLFNSGVWRSETKEWIQWAGTGGATWQVEDVGLLEFP